MRYEDEKTTVVEFPIRGFHTSAYNWHRHNRQFIYIESIHGVGVDRRRLNPNEWGGGDCITYRWSILAVSQIYWFHD